MAQKQENKEFKLAKREFKRLSKRALIEIIFELQTQILNLKAKNVELERMLEERGDVILSLEKQLNESNSVKEIEAVAKGNRALLQELVSVEPKLSLWEKVVGRVRGFIGRKNKNTRL